jgi:ribosome recycling factor
MDVKQILHDTEDKMKKSVDAVGREFAHVRTGRAHPSLIEGIHIEYYGTPTLVKQIASISVPDARLLVIQPWDTTIIAEIEKAIIKANLGIMPANDGKVIRLSIPQLSKERRAELAKMVKDMAENGRVSLRTIRRDAVEAVKRLEKDSKIAEDDCFKAQEEIQKITDKHIAKVDEVLKAKEKELAEF